MRGCSATSIVGIIYSGVKSPVSRLSSFARRREERGRKDVQRFVSIDLLLVSLGGFGRWI